MPKCLWTAITALALLITASATASANPLPINQLPMYGGRAKTEEMKSADADFIASIEKGGLSRADGAKQVLGRGWAAWAKGDTTTAMARFNQAWLLDPENGNVYHGFALITAGRDGTASEVERFFRLATSSPKVDAEAFVDYGKFLWMVKRLDESQAELNKALRISATARNARSHMAFTYYLKNDFTKACTWAWEARNNGDELERGFLEEMCNRAGKPDEGKPASPAGPPA